MAKHHNEGRGSAPLNASQAQNEALTKVNLRRAGNGLRLRWRAKHRNTYNTELASTNPNQIHNKTQQIVLNQLNWIILNEIPNTRIFILNPQTEGSKDNSMGL